MCIGKFTANYALDTPDTYGAYVTVRDDGVSPPTSAVFKSLNIRILPGSADAAMTEIAGADASLVAGTFFLIFHMENVTDVVFCSQEPRVAWRSD